MITSFFNKNSLVLTLNGYKKINEITTKDVVTTQNGLWKKVVDIKTIKSKTKILKLKHGLQIIASPGSLFYTRTLGSNLTLSPIEILNDNLYLSYPVQQEAVNNSFKNVLSKSLEEQDSFLKSYFALIEYNTKVSVPFEKIENSLSLQKLLLNNYKNVSPIHCIMSSFIYEYNLNSPTIYSNNTLWYNNIESVVEGEEEELYGLEIDQDNSFTIFNIAIGNN